ncbi:MAG: hypothetical protein IJ094_07185 [Bacilli bacterium]|nr:hypothetical protein [Bacilli bacterium]
MKQVIPFEKDLSFNDKISEITSIALEHNLKMENNDSIVGDFIVSGKYKINAISTSEKDFEEKLLFDITLDDKYDSSKIKIDIEDFYYEIINEEYLRVHINVLIDNLVYIKESMPVKEEIINEDKKEIVIDNNKDLREELVEDMKVEDATLEENDNINLTSNFLDNKENYSCYKVHIIRGDESLDDVKKLYNVNSEELEKYNDLNNIVIGTKIIIPLNNE